MQLTPEQLKANYDALIAIIEENIESPRKEQLIELYDSVAEHMIMAPASGVKYFHLAFAGGYCIHVKNVVDAALMVSKVFKQMGGEIDFTKEELVFSALNHDLGKVGDGEKPYYVWNESEWHRKNQEREYNNNPELVNMSVTDRALWLLQKYQIPVTMNEWIAIKCSDGMYDETNKGYLASPKKEKQPRTNLINIVHWADAIACRSEYSKYVYDDLSSYAKQSK